jgi:UDPglucose 6-dehydrogenase
MSSIGVIGAGFVGGAIINAFKSSNLMVYDKNPKSSTHTLNDVLGQDFIFVCVPTPMKDKLGSECNLSIINECFSSISDIGSDAIFVIKSTVPIGTTEELQNQYPNLNIVHSPEFLTAKFANEDFLNADRHIVGYTNNQSIGIKAVELFETNFPTIPCLMMHSKESESVKYIANCFFATKVSFFNEMYLLTQKLGLNWECVTEGVIADRRIGKSHYSVPGHDGDKGFGGTCFPKDINALIHIFKQHDLEPKVLEAAWSVNLDVREDMDWARASSAVCAD